MPKAIPHIVEFMCRERFYVLQLLIAVLGTLTVRGQAADVNNVGIRKALDHFIQGTSLQIQGRRHADAILEFQQSLRYDTTAVTLAAIARSYFELRKYELAQEYAIHAISRDSVFASGWEILAEIRVASGDYDGAIQAIEQLSLHLPSRKVLLTLAQLVEPRNAQRSIELYERAMESGPDAQVLMRIASLHERVRNWQGYVNALQRLYVLEPSNERVARDLAASFVRLQRWPDVLRLLVHWSATEVVQEQHIDIWTQTLAEILSGTTKYTADSTPQLVAIVDRARERFSSSWHVCVLGGALALRMDDIGRAQKLFDAASRVSRGVADAPIQIANAWFGALEWQTGFNVLSSNAGNFPRDARFPYLMGIACTSLGNDSAAVVLFRHCLHLDPTLIDAWLQLGLVYDVLDQVDSSEHAYQRVLALDQDNHLACNNYAYLLATNKRSLDKARILSWRAVQQMPTNPSYLDTYAWVLFQQGLTDEAKKYIERAISKGATATHYEHYGDILEALGLLDDAVRAWTQSLQLDPDRLDIASRIARYR